MNNFTISLLVKILFTIYLFICYQFIFVLETHLSKVRKTFLLLLLHIALLISMSIYIHHTVRHHINQIKEGGFYKISNISLIKNQNGTIIGKIGEQNRQYENLPNIPPLILQTIISVEDNTFFSNYGISFQNIGLNLAKALFTNQKVAGASTITQQLSRNLFLSNKISILRKIKEFYLSIYLSYYLTKEQILEIYINHIYFGDNTYGIKSAARHFFQKNLNELDVEEIAFLVGLVKGPSYYIKHLTAAKERRDYVLGRMLKTQLITPEAYEIAKNKPLNLIAKKQARTSDTYAYIIENIKEFLRDKGLNAETGLIIHVTIEDDLQRLATQSLQSTLNNYESTMNWLGPMATGDRSLEDFRLYEDNNVKVVYLNTNGDLTAPNFTAKLNSKDMMKYEALIRQHNKSIVLVKKQYGEWYLTNPPQLNGALIIIDPTTGKILSSVGGRGLKYSFLDGVYQVKKSPGSICKIFACVAAFERGYTPSYELNDAPIYIDAKHKVHNILPEEIDTYTSMKIGKVVRNYDNKYLGLISLQNAFEKSRNVPFISLTDRLGVNTVKTQAIRMGAIDYNTPYYLSGTLGSIYVSIERMARSLCAIPNGGYKVDKLYFISKITNLNGDVLFEEKSDEYIKTLQSRIISFKSINMVESLCKGTIKNGTKNQLQVIGKELAGKTGTSQENKEASFVVWCGNYLIYILIYHMNETEQTSCRLWGGDLPIKIAQEILMYLKHHIQEIGVELN